MSLPEKIKSQIIKIITQALPSDIEVILFGSYAKGTESKYSDIDIAIKSKGPLDTAKWSMIEESFEESEIPQKIDVIDFHRVKDSFKEVINKEGITIYPEHKN